MGNGRNGTRLVAADVEESDGDGPPPQRRHECTQLLEQLDLGRRQHARQIELLDPEEADTVGAIVDRELDVVVRAEVGLHGDQLAVEGEGGLPTGVTAAH